MLNFIFECIIKFFASMHRKHTYADLIIFRLRIDRINFKRLIRANTSSFGILFQKNNGFYMKSHYLNTNLKFIKS